MALRKHDDGREAVRMPANGVGQGPGGLIKPICAVIAPAMKSDNNGPGGRAPEITRDVNLVLIFNSVHQDHSIQEARLDSLSLGCYRANGDSEQR
jgi:hypothetical protein